MPSGDGFMMIQLYSRCTVSASQMSCGQCTSYRGGSPIGVRRRRFVTGSDTRWRFSLTRLLNRIVEVREESRLGSGSGPIVA